MRLGLFGGTFDPVHYGHLLFAESAREQLALDEVWFLPAVAPPHKRRKGLTPVELRLELIELAIGGHERLRASRFEIERQLVYSADTVAALAAEHADWELFFLLGTDALADLPRWRNAEALCRLAVPAVAARAGHPKADLALLAGVAPPDRRELFARHAVEMPAIDLTSSEIRRRVAVGRSIRYRTPRAVEKAIESKGLYRTEWRMGR
jgi:nicotinate-nucleotide adenylyltransferase